MRDSVLELTLAKLDPSALPNALGLMQTFHPTPRYANTGAALAPIAPLHTGQF